MAARRLLTLLAIAATSVVVLTAPAGHADRDDATTPRARAIASRFSAGAAHTCAVLDDGRLLCWGEGADGRLGHGSTDDLGDDEPVAGLAAVALPDGRGAVAVSAGGAHSCAILDDGRVACWGDGAHGRLGYADTDDIGDDETPADNYRNAGIVPLPFGYTAVDVSAGAEHTCAVLVTGQVTCWGRGDAGRLGYGNTANIGDDESPATNPVNAGIVPLPGNQAAVAVSAGGAHTCALLVSGRVTCWGLGALGALGYGNTTNVGDNVTPATNNFHGGLVPLPGNQTALAVGAGSTHTCALLSGGGVVCWGAANFGQLGIATVIPVGDNELATAGVPLPGAQSAVGLAVGANHTCAVLTDGTVTCWGSGGFGRLGYGNLTTIGDDETPVANPVNGGRVPLPGGAAAMLATAGDQHTCVLLRSTALTCWGNGGAGRLGRGDTTSIGESQTAAAAGAIGLPPMSAAAAVSVDAATRVCAVAASGRVACWGTGPAALVDLPGRALAVAVTTSSTHACALLTDSTVACWAGGPSVLVAMPDGLGALAVTAGAGHTCALLTDRSVACRTDGAATRVAMPDDLGAVALDAAGALTCALLADRTVTCWSPPSAPAERIAPDATADVVGLDVGPTHACVVLDGGGVACWAHGAPPDEEPAPRVELPDDVPAHAVSTGTESACAVLVDLRVACWPLADPLPSDPATEVDLGSGATSVSAGDGHACALLADRTVRCWNPGGEPADPVALPTPLTPADYAPLAPARLLDTRPGSTTVDGLGQGTGRVAAGATYMLRPLGRGGVTADTTAVVLSVAAVAPETQGFLTVHPCDRPRPVASSLNFAPGATTAGTVVAHLGSTSTVCIFTNREIDLVVDVVGAVPASSTLTTLNPARLLDTRAGQPTVDGQFAGGGARPAGSTLALAARGRGGVPGTARTALLNITAVGPAVGGFVTVHPCDRPRPLASSLNFAAGTNTSNLVVTALSATGTACIYTNQAVHLVADVVAAHVQPTLVTDPEPGAYRPLVPERLLDTRDAGETVDGRFAGMGRLTGGDMLEVPILGRTSSAAATVATLTVTAISPEKNGYLTVWPCGGPPPVAATFTYRAEVTRGVTTLAALSPTGTVCVTANRDTDITIDLAGTAL